MRVYLRRERLIIVFSFLLGVLVLQLYFVRYDPAFLVEELLDGPISQDDSRLIHYIRKYYLYPPSHSPYHLWQLEGENYSENYIETLLAKLFKYKKNGIFFEAGAYDGETFSNTLFLERNLSWTGLLVEAIPSSVKMMKEKHRKAWISPTCLSQYPYPLTTNFNDFNMESWSDNEVKKSSYLFHCPDSSKYIMKIEDESMLELYKNLTSVTNCTILEADIQVQCFPLYSLLLAARFTEVDFLSLDIEGGEMDVLKTIPFDKVNIKTLLVEVDKVKNTTEMVELMRKNGYKVRTQIGKTKLSTLLKNDILFEKT